MFTFSQRSWQRLEGVHPDLVFILKETLVKSPIDFGVVEGLRSMERQKQLVAQKKSQTTNSKHLVQADGWGHAVDLVPYVNGKPSWDWTNILEMTEAIQTTLVLYPFVCRIRWGGAWTCINTTKSAKELKDAYVGRCIDKGKIPFLDGPHFEILKR